MSPTKEKSTAKKKLVYTNAKKVPDWLQERVSKQAMERRELFRRRYVFSESDSKQD